MTVVHVLGLAQKEVSSSKTKSDTNKSQKKNNSNNKKLIGNKTVYLQGPKQTQY